MLIAGLAPLTACAGPPLAPVAPEPGPGAVAQQPAAERLRIRDVSIVTRDVYAEAEAEQSWIYRVVNALHWPTREETIRRELWVGEGDEITPAVAAEIERNLRWTGLFGDVVVDLVETDEEGVVDLSIRTRDRLSLSTGAAGFFVGGVSGFRVNVGEDNLFGTGDQIAFSITENSDDETSANVSFTDRHVLGSRHRLSVSAGRTEEGPQLAARFERPLWHLEDPFSYGVSASFVDGEADFFEKGKSVAEVPNQVGAVGAYFARTSGPRDARTTLGIDVRMDEIDFAPATGVQADEIRVPGDLRRLTVGPFVRHNWVERFHKEVGLDSIDAVEDVVLGLRSELFAGGVVRDEEGVGTRLEPTISVGLRGGREVLPDTYLTLSGSERVRWHAGDVRGWSASAALHAYQLSLPSQVFAASVAFDGANERENLPVQLTLGEDNGLRGYPAREFAGTRRMRVNVEDRIDTGLQYRSLHLGVVPFFDVGWIEDEGWGDPLSSVGVGLRLGSSELFGQGVLRLDLAFPLSERDGEQYDPTISFAFGQVFTFFGNSSLLPGR